MAEVYVGYVDVDIEDFDTEDLKEELERRGESVGFDESGYTHDLLKDLYEKRRSGQDYTYELDQIIYYSLGRVS